MREDNDVGEIEIQTDSTLLEVAIAIEKLKKYKSPGIDQIPAELIQDGGNSLLTEIYKLYSLFGKTKCYQNSGRNP